ncbi:Sigma factor, ECF subfamily [Nitrospira japonica]|uniref:Sigma factor, ECF subfamily n=1 Tax=Nitrospira japonica TaxID=1325564 RepID=A0A1W1IAT7_9BACT|nr:RNA polymerase sigma factor [Nitrospira japonica]SLM50095.1 Sigma factor, ECF subfamily [Nitrospira japonica]
MSTEKDLGSLFLAHRPELQAWLTRKLRCPHMAADFTQDIFLRLAELPASKVIGNVRSYLYRSAHNLVIDHFRKAERQQTFPTAHEQLLDIPEERAPADVALSAHQEWVRLQAVLGNLPERTQHIFMLNRVDGLTYTQVASRLGISESSVQKHLSKALLEVMTHCHSREHGET